MTITIEIPLPPAAVSPNARGHWSKKAKATKEYREIAMVKALAATRSMRPRYEKVEIEYEFYCARTPGCVIPRDDDNARACLKGVQDGFKDAGLFVDDSASRVTVTKLIFHRLKKDHKGRSCVVAHVTPIDCEVEQ